MAFNGTADHDAAESQFGRSLAAAEPAFGMSWFEAVEYCRWLTVKAMMKPRPFRSASYFW